jgi:hypothetical protein
MRTYSDSASHCHIPAPVQLDEGTRLTLGWGSWVSPDCEEDASVNCPRTTDVLIVSQDLRGEPKMRVVGLVIVVTLPALLVCPAGAQDVGRPQDGFYSGQSNGQYSGQWNGQVDTRVDGRGSRNEGLPPSASDNSNRRFDNPIDPGDCAEAEMLRPDARRGWQERVRNACQ